MSLTADQITAKNLKKFTNRLKPFLNTGDTTTGFTPIGTIIAVMGNTAPLNYLACDGTVYSIADYLELASYFEEQFGSKNYFGGDGTTTFAVPDLRGEFLRGAGTNSHENQGNGANVGVHQDATVNIGTPLARSKTDNRIILIGPINESYISGGSDASYDYYKELNVDKTFGRSKQGVFNSAELVSNTDNWSGQYTARPTNTSILYCIATKNIVIGHGSWVELTGTLLTGETTITFESQLITSESFLDVYTDADIPYNSSTVTTGSLVLTFDEQDSDVTVKVRVS